MARDKKSPGKIDRLLGRSHGRRGGRRGPLRRRRPAQAHEEAYGRTDPGSRTHRSPQLGETWTGRQEPRQLAQRQDDQDAQRRQGRLVGRDPPTPRGSFEPKLFREYRTRWPDYDDKIISMYAKDMSNRIFWTMSKISTRCPYRPNWSPRSPTP